jgi:DNA-binding NarL/FixJ family response regulator
VDVSEIAFGVLLVEDDPLCRERLAQGIREQPRLELLADVDTMSRARDLIQKRTPDVLVVDIGLPDGSGIDLIRECKAASEETVCLVVTIHGDVQRVFEALSAGAAGYLLKDAPLSELGAAILSAIDGDTPISPRIANALLKHLQPIKNEASAEVEAEAHHLTRREEEILNYLAYGFSRSEIADKLNISINTVSIHIKNTYRKLDVNSGSKAVFKARQYGLLKDE